MSESMHGGRRPDNTMTAAQQVALAAVKRGRDVEGAAVEAGVSRMTVYRWIKADPIFRAAYNAWEDAARQSARARLVTVLDKALDKVMCCVESDSRLAFKVVAAMGAFAPGGALQTDPDRVRQEMELEEQEQDRQIKRRMKRLGRGSARVISCEPATALLGESVEARELASREADAAAMQEGRPVDAETAESASAAADPVSASGEGLVQGNIAPALMLMDILISSLEAKDREKEAPAPQASAPPTEVIVANSGAAEEARKEERIDIVDAPPAVQEVAASLAVAARVDQPPAENTPAPIPAPDQPAGPAPTGLGPGTEQCYKNGNVTFDDPDLDPRSPWCEATYHVW